MLWIQLLSLASLSFLFLHSALQFPTTVPGSGTLCFFLFHLGISSNSFVTVLFEVAFCSCFVHFGFSGAVVVRIISPSKDAIWISHSRQRGKRRLCLFFGIVHFAFLLGSFGCFLDPMGAENLPFWRYLLTALRCEQKWEFCVVW